ncbi:hypothetical protein P171DRAFT_436505 [Karstenula rhodostoma CBS 690.94]|uniref:Uncharacterized protein n=1 Tax=Karstenula rhodostoma CBS 690.94 TaxID=1392251 RepID=A0A9P4P866_9PLEO|nr:hypothetical protein P171DRAFT_436505 [Karstenula rhodostoma CBS 690.94]
MSTPTTADDTTYPHKLNPADTTGLMHWSIYGRRGNPSTTRATASSWQYKPFSKPVTQPWDHVIPYSELPKLLHGFVPGEMEDKWFVYADGPDAQGNAAVHFYRSWTGFYMVEAKLVMEVDEKGEVREKDARFTEITWETDRERYNGDMDAQGTVLAVAEWCMMCQLRPETSTSEDDKAEEPGSKQGEADDAPDGTT